MAHLCREPDGSRTRIAFADVTTRIVDGVAVITGRNDIEGGGGCCETASETSRSASLKSGGDEKGPGSATFPATFIER